MSEVSNRRNRLSATDADRAEAGGNVEASGNVEAGGNGAANGHSANGAGQRRTRATAQSMAAKQRDISVSEFFEKNRHLLGFGNDHRALLTTVKEAVDNSLDACEEAGIVPELWIHIQSTGERRF